MANYYMYTYDLATIRRARNNNQVKPLSFSVRKKEVRNKFTLEELDSITTLCPDEETLLVKLSKSKEYAPYINSDSKITIVHKSKGTLVSDDVVYNDKFLFRCAKEVRDRKDNGETETDIYLNATKEVNEFTSRMKNYLLNDDLFKLLMSDRKISSNPHLRELMENYNYLMSYATLEPDQQKFLDEVEKKLDANLRKYKTLRKFVVWEKKYLNKEITPDVNYVQQEIDLNKIVPVKEKEHTNQQEIKKIVPRKRYSLDDLLGENNNFGRDNDPLTYWYNEGGVAAVLNNMDLDDILSYSKEDLDSVGLGYLKENSDSVKESYEKRK